MAMKQEQSNSSDVTGLYGTDTLFAKGDELCFILPKSARPLYVFSSGFLALQ